jgi:hypothetical protein
VEERAAREAESSVLEAEMAEACGVLNAAAGRLVEVIAKVLHTGVWQVAGICSAAQWVAWQCGVSPGHAAALVAMARRRSELPVTMAALEAGELSEDQVAVVCRRAPATVDAEVAELARSATVAQLRRVLSRYVFAAEAGDEEPENAQPDNEPPTAGAEPRPGELRQQRPWLLAPVRPASPR